jgi:hypothetical protein
MKKLLILLFLCCKLNVYSSIESITIQWSSLFCKDQCIALLEKEFRKIRGVEQLSIDQEALQAVLVWKPNEPFQYSSINYAARAVGLSIRSIRIRVNGTITHSGDRFYLVSQGDNTRFELLNPIIPVPGEFTSKSNEAIRKIIPPLRDQLLEGERNRQIATVEGPIFMPNRNTVPAQIVVDHLDFSEPQK